MPSGAADCLAGKLTEQDVKNVMIAGAVNPDADFEDVPEGQAIMSAATECLS